VIRARVSRPKAGAEHPVEGTHEWVSFPDDEHDTTWLFDVTFLESNWTCIYGRGCHGVLTGPAAELEEGCCSYGAHFTGAADRRRVEKAASRLKAAEWQFISIAKKRNGPVRRDKSGDTVTRLTDGACIFLNRPGFAGGPGCALHSAALARGERPLDWKPDVCWQIPLHRQEERSQSGHLTVTIRQWDRADWGAGGSEFHWWCTQSPEAFIGSRPVHEELREELAELVTPSVHEKLDSYLRWRRASVTPVPHPALRTRPAAVR
jgi:hypothetical protein